MPKSDAGGEPVWTDLDVARAPTDAELRLLRALTMSVAEPLLQAQVENVVIDGLCRCGCSSVRLRSAASAIPPDRIATLSSRGRDDYLAVHAQGQGSGGRASVSVVLHVIEGRVGELEVFDGVRGEGAAVPLELLTSLTEPTVD